MAGSKHLVTLLFLMGAPCLIRAAVSAESPGPRCGPVELRYELREGKSGTGKPPLCVSSDGIHLYSESCLKSVEKCMAPALKALPPPDERPAETQTGFGSPGFRRCREVGGTPRFAEYRIGGNWKMIASCFLLGDKLILDNDTLYAAIASFQDAKK
jgi:hypothetical protein